MKQRLGIAAAMLGRSRTADPRRAGQRTRPAGHARDARARSLRLAARDRTVLVSSHVLSELEQVCDWLVLIDTGRSVYQGPAAEFLDRAAALVDRHRAARPRTPGRRPRRARPRRPPERRTTVVQLDRSRPRRVWPPPSTRSRSTPGSSSSRSAPSATPLEDRYLSRCSPPTQSPHPPPPSEVRHDHHHPSRAVPTRTTPHGRDRGCRRVRCSPLVAAFAIFASARRHRDRARCRAGHRSPVSPPRVAGRRRSRSVPASLPCWRS